MLLKICEVRPWAELPKEVKDMLRQKHVEALRDEGELSTMLTDAFEKELESLGYPKSVVFSFGLERRASEGVGFYGQITNLQALRNRLLPHSGRTLSNRFLDTVTVMVNRVPHSKIKSTMGIKLQPSGSVNEMQQTALDSFAEALLNDIKATSDRLTALGRKIIEEAGSNEKMESTLAGEDQLYFID